MEEFSVAKGPDNGKYDGGGNADDSAEEDDDDVNVDKANDNGTDVDDIDDGGVDDDGEPEDDGANFDEANGSWFGVKDGEEANSANAVQVDQHELTNKNGSNKVDVKHAFQKTDQDKNGYTANKDKTIVKP